MPDTRAATEVTPAPAGGRARALLLTVLFAAATCLWVVFTVTERHDKRLFFGLWRLRHIAVAAIGGWLTVAGLLRCLSRRSLLGWLLCTVVIALTAVLLELAGLIGIVSYPTLFGRHGEALGAKAVPNVDVVGETYQDLSRLWGYPAEPIPFRYKTDSRGFRNHNDRPGASLYMLGDSILVAGLLPFDLTVTALLEDELGRPTMNIGLIGLSPQEERDIFLDAKLPLEERLVLHFVFEGNDLKDSATYHRRMQAGGQAEKEPFVVRTLTYNLLMRLQRLSDPAPLDKHRRIGRINGKDYLFGWLRDSFEGYTTEFEHVAAALNDLRLAVGSAGGVYAVVFVPAKIRVLGPLCTWPTGSTLEGHKNHLNPMRAWLTEWCEAQGITMLDLTDPLIESARTGRIPWFTGDTHPNAIGHRVAADAIKEWDVVKEWDSRAGSAG